LGISVVDGPREFGANPTSAPKGADTNSCKRAFDLVSAEPFTEGAQEAIGKDLNHVSDAWFLWKFSTDAEAEKAMTDVAAIGRDCVLSGGFGYENFTSGVAASEGFESILPSATASSPPVDQKDDFVRSGKIVARIEVLNGNKDLVVKALGTQLESLPNWPTH
jgi:hypothetical protein